MKIKKILTFVFAAALMTSCGNEDGPGGDGGNGGGTEHTEYFGVNMSGAEFGNVYPGVDGTHYGYPTKKDLEYFKEKGLRMIRFPFRWERIQSEMNGPLITTELAKMKEFVQAAEDLNMKVLLDMHNFGRYCVYSNGVNSDDNQFVVIGNAQCTVENFCDVWKKLAAEFKDYKCIWGYDIMNEPYGMLRTTPWETIAQACINAIREVDTETMLVISGIENIQPTTVVIGHTILPYKTTFAVFFQPFDKRPQTSHTGLNSRTVFIVRSGIISRSIPIEINVSLENHVVTGINQVFQSVTHLFPTAGYSRFRFEVFAGKRCEWHLLVGRPSLGRL